MSAMLRELADAPHLSMRLRRAPHETAGSSFHASSPSSAEGAHAAASAHDSGTEGDESPRSLPQLQPLLSGDLELSESEVASSALLTARTLLTSRAGSKEHAKLMQTPEVTDRAAARQMTPDSPRSPASRPADSPSGSAGVARCAPELLDLDAGSAWSSPASGLGAGPWRSGPLAGPVVAAAPRAERVPPLPLGRRGAAAERPPLPQLPLPLEEAAARAGYAWEPETDEEYQERRLPSSWGRRRSPGRLQRGLPGHARGSEPPPRCPGRVAERGGGALACPATQFCWGWPRS
ncbi:unnamed protein product [Prorocentrum cordatum]|uniref:Uncharacterized protein n=1 Tax=Prorocentrum cordatum TaxID=2364126 RepID=A0ABN9UGS1_9DINO|nr:unnamed protein product [Polarella glacialis]